MEQLGFSSKYKWNSGIVTARCDAVLNVFSALIATSLCIPFIHLLATFATIVNKIYLDFNGYITLFLFVQ